MGWLGKGGVLLTSPLTLMFLSGQLGQLSAPRDSSRGLGTQNH